MTNAINPTEGRVYGGASNLIHIADGQRENVGAYLARMLDAHMRAEAVRNGARSEAQAWGDPDRRAPRQQLCPGCYMVAIVAAAVKLAEENDQSVQELGRSLSVAFDAIAKNGTSERNMEWIDVQLDPPQIVDGIDLRTGAVATPQQQQQAQDDGDLFVAMARAGVNTFPGVPL